MLFFVGPIRDATDWRDSRYNGDGASNFTFDLACVFAALKYKFKEIKMQASELLHFGIVFQGDIVVRANDYDAFEVLKLTLLDYSVV